MTLKKYLFGSREKLKLWCLWIIKQTYWRESKKARNQLFLTAENLFWTLMCFYRDACSCIYQFYYLIINFKKYFLIIYIYIYFKNFRIVEKLERTSKEEKTRGGKGMKKVASDETAKKRKIVESRNKPHSHLARTVHPLLLWGKIVWG